MKDLNLVPNSIDALPLAAPQEVLSKATHGCFVIYKLYNLFLLLKLFWNYSWRIFQPVLKGRCDDSDTYRAGGIVSS